jgi:uncharacterized protein (TIGR03067 family)
VFATVITLALVVSADPPKEKELPEAARKELKKLEGNWKFVKGVSLRGEEKAEGKLRDFILEFKRNQMLFKLGDETKDLHWLAAIDASADPKCIDILEKSPGKPGRILEGVYKVDGDRLVIAMRMTGNDKQRPVTFDKPTDPLVAVLSFQRKNH